LQYDVRSNLNGLSEYINKTSRELDEAKKNLQNEYRREKIDWEIVAQCKDAISDLEAGLASLKEDRQMLFPDWKEVATED